MYAIVVVDLVWGDCGKGSVVDYLTRETGARLVFRFNGGGQAAHFVTLDDGRSHCFSQFGSGTLAGADTYLSRFMVIDPLAMEAEARHLEYLGVADPFRRLHVDEEAVIVTTYHQALNRRREMARSVKHGTCGVGIGEVMADVCAGRPVLRMKDLHDRDRTHALLCEIQAMKEHEGREVDQDVALTDSAVFDTPSALLDDYRASGLVRLATTVTARDRSALFANYSDRPIIGEGAQGVLLDERYGFHPHTTWSTTTFENAETVLCDADWHGDIRRVGVLRAYATRHGHGPFPTEDARLVVAGHEHNTTGQWQGAFRIGHFDGILARYALHACGRVDELALTHLDCRHDWWAAERYVEVDAGTRLVTGDLAQQERLGTLLSRCHPLYRPCASSQRLTDWIDDYLGVPITLASYGPTAAQKVRIVHGIGTFHQQEIDTD